MKMKNWLVLIAIVFFLEACGVSPEEQSATQTAIVEASEKRKADLFATQTAAPPAPTSTPATFLTLDGTENGELVTPNINLWDNYDTRNRVVATAKHGEQVKLIRRSGDGVLVELKNGKQGWVTYYFIKEYK